MRATYWVWRRELAVLLRAPILYVVGGLFLVVQGIAFAGLVGALSDPRRPAPLGALFEGQLAGTLLTWVLELVVLSLLGMRTIADDKRAGSWEALLTAGVGEGAAVAGKWLAAVTVYVAIWLPTLAYLALVAAYRADAGGWDAPAIALGYAGAIAIGASLLAWAIAASAATSSLLAAGALGFAWLIGIFLVGELPGLWPALAVDHPALAAVLDTASLRTIATGFARGLIAGRAVIVLAGLAVVGLSLAITLACAGRRRRREVVIRGAGTLVLAACAALVAVLVGPRGVDLSAARRNSLADATRDVLAELSAPATITILAPTLGALEPVYDEVARVADRIAAAAPAITVRRVDPVNAPGGLAAAARAVGLAAGDLSKGGAIVVGLGGGQRVIDLLTFAVIEPGPGGAPIVGQLAIEQAIAGALAQLAAPRPLTVCVSQGHGEPAWTTPVALPGAPAAAPGRDWAMVAQRLAGDGMTIAALDGAAIPAACSVVVVAGPRTPLPAEAALAISRFVQRGGGLIVATDVDPARGALPTGLEGVLAGAGLGFDAAVAIDPDHPVRELPGAFYVFHGYADHPIDRGFVDQRVTLWFQPLVVDVARGAPLISAGPQSWGERDLVDPPARDARDRAGPVAVAAIGADHRVIAIGSAESFTSRVLALGSSAGDLWLSRAVRFVAGRGGELAAPAARAPDQVRLVMSDGERRAVIALSVGGLPLAWAIVGGAIVWWRRRRAR